MENEKNSSSLLIDVIDLTTDTPRRSAQRPRRARVRRLSPITLGTCDLIDPVIDKVLCDVTSIRKTPLDDNLDVITLTKLNKETSQGLSCPICLESLSSDLQPTATRCGHIFCASCLKTCLAEKIKKCPTCTSAITAKTCIRLYF